MIPSESALVNSNIERSLTVSVPGSTSNLGPGFDTLGLAVAIYNTVRFDVLKVSCPDVPLVAFSSRNRLRLPADASNHVFKVFKRQWCGQPELLQRLRITIDCDVPISGGLGSSGTATLAAIFAARHLCDFDTCSRILLREATAIEGHPDNVSPSLLGGFCVSSPAANGAVHVEKLVWPEEWKLVFLVPQREVRTCDARAALPKMIKMSDAVHNLQKVSLLLAAVVNKSEERLAAAFDDCLHEPYRAHLVPELNGVRRLLRGMGTIGTALSGAGPTVVTFCHENIVDDVVRKLQDWALVESPGAKVMPLGVDACGLKFDEATYDFA